MRMSEEKREQWLAAQQDREAVARAALVTGVSALAQRQGWVGWLDFAARLPHYSLGNQLLLASQLPDARMVMSADQWRQVGRWPSRGTTALRIWAPRRGRSTQSDVVGEGPEPAADGQRAAARDAEGRVRFLLVPVFDVSQTEGAALPEQPRPVPPPPGKAPVGMWAAMVDYAEQAGFTVCHGDTGPADGMTDFATSTITIADRDSELAQTLTLAHELGHMALHGDPATRDPNGVHRGRAEVQAESVAYLVACEYEMHDAAQWHFDYLTHWAARVGADAAEVVAGELRHTATGVLSAARPLLAHLAEACVGHPDPLTQRGAAPAPPVVAEVAR